MAFVSAVPVLGRSAHSPVAAYASTFSSVRFTAAPARRANLRMALDNENKSIPQGFTFFSEQLNGRAAMVGFTLALLTEALTGKGIVGQLASIGEVVNSAKALIG